jgi:hypothetical protein
MLTLLQTNHNSCSMITKGHGLVSVAFIYVTLVVTAETPRYNSSLSVKELSVCQYIYCKYAYPLEFQCPIT